MSTEKEFAALRQLLKSLESGEMRIFEDREDVTQREIDLLKPEIKTLETILALIAASGRRGA